MPHGARLDAGLEAPVASEVGQAVRGHGRFLGDAPQPRRVGVQQSLAPGRVAVLDRPAHEGLQHLQAAVAEGAMVQVPEDHIALTEQAVAGHHFGEAAG
eukprot:6225-Eustigmatos_ZCMA.PRE.1